MLEAGFEKIEVSVERQQRNVPDIAAFAGGFDYGSPVVDQIRQRGQTDPAKVRDAIAAEMRREFGGDPGTVALQAIMFEATKI